MQNKPAVLTYDVKTLKDDDEMKALGLIDDYYMESPEGEADMFVAPAWTILDGVPLCDGQDCIIISLPDMNVSDLTNGSRDVCAGVATLWYGKHHPCLMLNDGLIGIDAETILDAHIEVGEPLLIVFDCKDGCVLTRANFTAELENQLKAIVAVKDFLPAAKVGDDGRIMGETKYAALDAAYFGFA
ncbi:hypothetical protein OKW49_002766 [Paraburkholderia youngii]|uniref:hypothetical protein n=1 Tax=Paraburkholderia youngii TaxID=2782701 RepID=UPI003D20162E